MDAFLAAQADSPFDPAPMLIWADHLEERGDLAGAVGLRGLAGAGIPSLLVLALDAALISRPWSPDKFKHVQGDGQGDGACGYRSVQQCWRRDGYGGGYGDTFDFGNQSWHGEGASDNAWVANEDHYDETING